MNHITFGTVLAGVLFLGMFGIMELGRCIGERNLNRDPDGAKLGVGVVEGGGIRATWTADGVYLFRCGHSF